jgi:chemotaxis protein MotA
VLRCDMDALAVRHRSGKAVLEQMGRFAPALGMVGTLMGLIIMLGNMNSPDAIAPAMAVAMITTFYGVLAANFLFLPFAEKLGNLTRQELLAMEMIVRGVLAIQAGENPRVIQQRLNSFLPGTRRMKLAAADRLRRIDRHGSGLSPNRSQTPARRAA